MRGTSVFAAASLALGLLTAAPQAHHSIQISFDTTKTNTITGTITKMDWRNPHAWLHVEAKDASGAVQAWQIEFGSANSLYRRGWRREDLPVGATVIVSGYVSREGSRTLGATDVKLADGRRLFAGTAPTEGGK
jgi:hypothetical protein